MNAITGWPELLIAIREIAVTILSIAHVRRTERGRSIQLILADRKIRNPPRAIMECWRETAGSDECHIQRGDQSAMLLTQE
jgi:hypothetical protein